MKVKIYREPENERLILDESELEQYRLLTDRLGIQNEHKEKTPNVYTPINNAMEKLLKALCPSVSDVEKYTYSTIPLEVLQVMDYAVDNKMFDGYKIWYANNNPDPLLIGWTWKSPEDKEKGYSWSVNNFLIARWGDESLETRELLQKGFDSLKISLIDSAGEAMNFCRGAIENPDQYVRAHLKNSLTIPRIEINGSSDMGSLPF